MVDKVETLTELRQWEGRSLEEFIRAMVAMFVAVNTGRRGVLRALITRCSQDAQFRDKVHQINHLIRSARWPYWPASRPASATRTPRKP
jgi:DNA-binding cell septation regulator SpoVG